MRPRQDLRIPFYTEARPLVSYAVPPSPARFDPAAFAARTIAPPRAFAKPRREKPARRRFRGLAPSVAAALLIGWVVASVPAARTAVLSVSTPALSAIGFALAPPPVQIAEVHARRTEIDGQTLLYVEGQLVNKSKKAQKPPTVLITIVGSGGEKLYSWKTRIVAKTLGAAEPASFQARLLSPPEKFESLKVTLVGEG